MAGSPHAHRIWLAAWFTCLVIGTLAPFDFAVSDPGFSARLHGAFTFDLTSTLSDLPSHFVGFAGLGIVLAGAHSGWLRSKTPSAVLLAALVFCVTLDALQVLLPDRHGHLSDAVMNALALGLTLLFCTRTSPGKRFVLTLHTLAHRRAGWLAGILIAAATIAWTYIGLQPTFGSLRMNWDRSFPILIGNEIYPPRPWLGEIQFVRIYDRALDEKETTALAQAASTSIISAPPEITGLLLGYDFREDANVAPLSSGSLLRPALELSVPTDLDRTFESGAIFDRPAAIASRAAASSLSDAIETSGAFSIEVKFRPGNLHQGGPARLVTFSDGWRKRNFMLGQEGSDLVFRVRNGVNGLSGSPYALKVPDVVDADWQHVVAVYDHGVSRLYKNGRRFGPTVDLLEPSFYFPLGDRQIGWTVTAVLLISLIALPLLLLLRSTQPASRHFCALAFAFAVGTTPYLVACAVIGAQPSFSFPAWLGAALIVVYPLFARYVAPTAAPFQEKKSLLVSPRVEAPFASS